MIMMFSAKKYLYNQLKNESNNYLKIANNPDLSLKIKPRSKTNLCFNKKCTHTTGHSHVNIFIITTKICVLDALKWD